MIGAVVGVRAQGSPRPPAPEIAGPGRSRRACSRPRARPRPKSRGGAGGPRPAPATEPGFVRVPAPGVLSGHGEHGPLLRVPAPGWGVATIPVFPPYPALRIPAPGESMLHEVYAPNYRQARPRPGEVDSVMSPGLALRRVGSHGSSAGGLCRAELARREVGWIALRWARITQAGPDRLLRLFASAAPLHPSLRSFFSYSEG